MADKQNGSDNPVNTVKKSMSLMTKVGIAIATLVVIGLIWWFISWIIEKVPKVAASTTVTPLPADGFLGKIVGVILGSGAVVSIEALILFIAIFVIILFAMQDILNLFSTFSETTSFVIGLGLALVAGVTGLIDKVAQIFAITAGVGAIGIALIIFGAIASAVILNLGIGGPLKRWRTARDSEIESFKTTRGFSKVADFVGGAKQVAGAASAGEK